MRRKKTMYIVLPNYDSFPFDGARSISHGNYTELQFNVNGGWESLVWYDTKEQADAVKREIVQNVSEGKRDVYYIRQEDTVEPIWLR